MIEKVHQTFKCDQHFCQWTVTVWIETKWNHVFSPPNVKGSSMDGYWIKNADARRCVTLEMVSMCEDHHFYLTKYNKRKHCVFTSKLLSPHNPNDLKSIIRFVLGFD